MAVWTQADRGSYRTESANRFRYAALNPAANSDPSGFFAWYAGLGAVAGTAAFVYLGLGQLIGVGGDDWDPVVWTATAYTHGVGIGASVVNLGVGFDWGIYWGVDKPSDYRGPFVQFSVGFGPGSLGEVWGVDPEKYKALSRGQGQSALVALWGAITNVVGLAGSYYWSLPIDDLKGLPFVPSATVTYSWVFWAGSCRSKGLPPVSGPESDWL